VSGSQREGDEAARYRRSPFCLLHWQGADLFAQNCDTQRLFRIAERYFGILHRLSDWTTAAQLAASLSLNAATVEHALDRLVGMGLVTECGPGPGEPLPQGRDETGWELVDLALQRRTSRGGYDASAHRGTPPPPASKPLPPSPAIELDRRGLEDGVSLRTALEDRRSLRTYSVADLRLDDLGRFLFSAARVTGRGSDPVAGEISYRPSPSAGARNALEIYAVCNAVAGLEPGAYYYDPRGHALHLVRRADAGQAKITRHARAATGGALNRDPPLLVVVTAVFARTMWKYRNIALSLILKDVGALYQTMYLVATALGLAPCALGGWMEEENARWLGLDPLVESQVGCFLLGYPPGRSPGDVAPGPS
jgi:SagB-type dehydrogenase family enzyme